MMSFDYLWLLPAAVVLPIAIVLLLMRADRQRRARLARLGELEIVRRLVPPSGTRSMRWRMSRLATAGALVGIADRKSTRLNSSH